MTVSEQLQAHCCIKEIAGTQLRMRAVTGTLLYKRNCRHSAASKGDHKATGCI